MVLELSGLDCADCARKLEKKLAALPGVQEVTVNFGAAKLYLNGTIAVERVIRAVREAGYEAFGPGQTGQQVRPFLLQNRRAFLTGVSGILALLGFLASIVGFTQAVIPLYSGAILVGGYYTVRAGIYSLRDGLSFDMNVLMTIAVGGAIAIGEWEEAVAVVFLFSLGNTLEAYTMEKTRRSIRRLTELTPQVALVRKNGGDKEVPVEEVHVGDTVIIRPGARIPVDGVVVLGSSAVNQAAITGEAIPAFKGAGDEVFAGTLNENGVLEVSVTRLQHDTTLARIIEMVEEAQGQKAPSQRFVDVFAAYYTPVVIGLAVIMAVVPPVVLQTSFTTWFYRALTLLVVSCPCALVISTPVSIVASIGNAASKGVLIKGGVYLEQAGRIKVVAFDKTGTLTRGRPEVTDIVPVSGRDEEEILALAAAIEQRSEHPLASAILARAEAAGLELLPVQTFFAVPGKGARATFKGQEYFIGSLRFFREDLARDVTMYQQTVDDFQDEGKTVILLGTRDKIEGIIAVADKVREESPRVVQRLKASGIRTVMLTGDNQRTARAVAEQIELDEFQGELLPENKVAAVRSYEKELGPVAMIGDGINDAPALALASIGIAMGGAGTDTALETSDIALMSDDLEKIPFAISLSQKALSIIKQNIFFALAVKLAAIALVFPGILTLWIAIAADTGASLIVIANGMRLLRVE
ncbi:MAG TPA: cadmium-translocating P-type ATPase [Clostridia bacterium]|nr:cadmium-translocating P-type ATPase [Clostridia bacterium]